MSGLWLSTSSFIEVDVVSEVENERVELSKDN